MRSWGGYRCSESKGISAYSQAQVFLSNLELLLRRISPGSGLWSCNEKCTVFTVLRLVRCYWSRKLNQVRNHFFSHGVINKPTCMYGPKSTSKTAVFRSRRVRPRSCAIRRRIHCCSCSRSKSQTCGEGVPQHSNSTIHSARS